jgi:hypothetical protein
MYIFFIQSGQGLGVCCWQMNYIDPKELTPSNDNYLPLDTASYLRKFESTHVIFLLFSTQECCDTVFSHLS